MRTVGILNLGMKFVRILFSVGFIGLFGLLENCYITDEKDVNKQCHADCTTIKGRFLSENATTGVSRVHLELSWNYQSGQLTNPFGFYRNRKIATAVTDDGGNFVFEFYAKDEELKNGDYSIVFSPATEEYIYLKDYNYLSIHGISKRDTTITYNYLLPKKASLKLIIANPNDIKLTDYLRCEARVKVDDPDGNTTLSVGGVNSNLESEYSFTTAGNQWTYLRIYKQKNGIQQEVKEDSVFTLLNNRITAYLLEF